MWFWPIIVALVCVLAALRLRRPALDERVARVLAAVALAAFAVAGTGQQLHGRPTVSVGQEITLAVALAFVAWGAGRLIRRRHGWFTFFLSPRWPSGRGASLIAVLVDGYVLLALPAFVARLAVVDLPEQRRGRCCRSSSPWPNGRCAAAPAVAARARRGGRRRPREAPAGDEGREAWQPSA